MSESNSESTGNPWPQMSDRVVKEARRISLLHLKSQQGLPEELMPALLTAEVNCRVNNGRVRPIVQVDNSENYYDMPPNTVVVDFLLECLRRHSADHVHCCMIVGGELAVGYVSKQVLWSASCPLQYQDDRVVFGDWLVKQQHAPQGGQAPKERPTRNAPCPCGSGRKYKKCCGSRHQQPSSHDTDDNVNEAEFARRLVSAIRHINPNAIVTYDADRACLLDDGQTYLNLENIFREFSATPTRYRHVVLQKCARAWNNLGRPLPESWEDARPDVLPRIYARAQYEHVMVPDADRRIYRIIGDHYAVGLVYDHRDTMEAIYADQLTAWGVSKEVAFSAALQNLRERSLPPQLSAHIGGVFVAEYHDDYDASRLLLPDIIASADVVGDPVVLIPNRRTLLIGGDNDSTGLCVMADLALESLQQLWPISGIVLRFHDGCWQPYQPPTGHPASGSFRDLWLRSVHQAYALQRVVLGTASDKHGIRCSVNQHFVLPELGHREAFSNATWVNGLPSLLPRVEVLSIIVDPPARHVIETEGPDALMNCEYLLLNWDEACSVLGDMLVRTDDYPERYLIQGMCEGARISTLRSMNRSDELMKRFKGSQQSGQ